jgi:hypothetical protein
VLQRLFFVLWLELLVTSKKPRIFYDVKKRIDENIIEQALAPLPSASWPSGIAALERMAGTALKGYIG